MTDNLTTVRLAIWSVEYPTFTYTGTHTGAPSALVVATLLQPSSGTGHATGRVALNGTQTFVTADQKVNDAAAHRRDHHDAGRRTRNRHACTGRRHDRVHLCSCLGYVEAVAGGGC